MRIWLVQLGGEGQYISHECHLEFSILEKPEKVLVANFNSIYEQEDIEDETLQMLVRPNQN